MPHIANFEVNGLRAPSVNEITDSLSKDGLIRNFWRRLGFKKADKIGNLARDQGIALASAFEDYRKIGSTKGKQTKYTKICIENWHNWYSGSVYTIPTDALIEPHLVNTVDGYHGSPDVILADTMMDMEPVLGDDKSKKRFCDYKLLMNEHAYAMCDSIEVGGKLEKLPWTPPIKQFWFWTYCPDCGNLYPRVHIFDKQVYDDFLTCKKMREVNKVAEAYFNREAVLLGCDHTPTE